jgi:hypothetical protein
LVEILNENFSEVPTPLLPIFAAVGVRLEDILSDAVFAVFAPFSEILFLHVPRLPFASSGPRFRSLGLFFRPCAQQDHRCSLFFRRENFPFGLEHFDADLLMSQQ